MKGQIKIIKNSFCSNIKCDSCNVYCRVKGDFGSVHRDGAKLCGWYNAVRTGSVGSKRYGTLQNVTIGMVP